jgi:transposase
MKKETPQLGIFKMGSGLPVFNPYAAGIDIGDTIHCVAINDGNGGHEVKTTSAFTCDLHDIVGYCKSNGVTTVAMESTGVYWLALYLLLEEAGIEPYLVNAKHAKNVTGRKKDDTDAIWLQKLHTCGLLQKSFQPDNEIRLLRSYTRQRKNLILLGSDSIRRMQKALELMNIKIHTVISDILGKTGMGMVKAILAGERNPEILCKLCDPRIKASHEDIIKSLDGIWKDEYLFMLEQAVETYEFHKKQVKTCEEKIQEQLLKQVALIKDGDITGLKETQKKKSKASSKKNQFDFSLLPYLIVLARVDLCKIPGISQVTALEFIAEVGLDMSKWKSPKHFAAWLNLTPNTKISGGKILSSKMMKKNNKAGQLIRQAASCLVTNKTPIGDYYRSMRARMGGKGAALATAHKLARIIYTMLLKQTEYNPGMIIENHEKSKEEKIKKLEKQIARLKQVA